MARMVPGGLVAGISGARDGWPPAFDVLFTTKDTKSTKGPQPSCVFVLFVVKAVLFVSVANFGVCDFLSPDIVLKNNLTFPWGRLPAGISLCGFLPVLHGTLTLKNQKAFPPGR